VSANQIVVDQMPLGGIAVVGEVMADDDLNVLSVQHSGGSKPLMTCQNGAVRQHLDGLLLAVPGHVLG
jgi:hypothetical protein